MMVDSVSKTEQFNDTQPRLNNANANDDDQKVIYNTNGDADDQDDTTTDNCCNSTIDNILNKVADNMGMKPISSRYKPIRTNDNHNSHTSSQSNSRRATPQSSNSSPYKRSHSTDILSTTSTTSTTGIRRRHNTTIRRNSIMPGNETNITISKQESTRQSFEIKNDALYSMAQTTDHTLENDLSLIQSFQIEQEYNSSQNFWIRLAIQSSSSKTSFKDLVKRSTFLVISVLTVGAGVLWGLMYVALGKNREIDDWVVFVFVIELLDILQYDFVFCFFCVHMMCTFFNSFTHLFPFYTTL